jgi:hypothetical protein
MHVTAELWSEVLDDEVFGTIFSIKFRENLELFGVHRQALECNQHSSYCRIPFGTCQKDVTGLHCLCRYSVWKHFLYGLMFVPFIVYVVEMTNTMHWFVLLLYCIYWLLHVSAVVCNHQGASWIRLSYLKYRSNRWYIIQRVVMWPVCRSVVVLSESRHSGTQATNQCMVLVISTTSCIILLPYTSNTLVVTVTTFAVFCKVRAHTKIVNHS